MGGAGPRRSTRPPTPRRLRRGEHDLGQCGDLDGLRQEHHGGARGDRHGQHPAEGEADEHVQPRLGEVLHRPALLDAAGGEEEHLVGGHRRTEQRDRVVPVGRRALTGRDPADDLVGRDLPEVQVVLAGDVCYERSVSARIVAWLRALAARGATVLLADPGRAFTPRDGLEELARHVVPTPKDLERTGQATTVVWRVTPASR